MVFIYTLFLWLFPWRPPSIRPPYCSWRTEGRALLPFDLLYIFGCQKSCNLSSTSCRDFITMFVSLRMFKRVHVWCQRVDMVFILLVSVSPLVDSISLFRLSNNSDAVHIKCPVSWPILYIRSLFLGSIE